MIKILIAENNENLISHYQNYLAKEENIEIIGIANDGKKALEIYDEKHPDLVLLDLGLPVLNGIQFIDAISQNSDKTEPNVIVISGDNKLRLNLINMKKVYMSISKPVDLDYLMSIIRSFEADFNKKIFPKQELNDLLLSLNLKTKTNSGKYVQQIVETAYNEPSLMNNLNRLYSVTANQLHCTAKKVQSNIRSSVRIINKCNNKDLLCSIFYISKYDRNQQISPKNLVYFLVEYLNRAS